MVIKHRFDFNLSALLTVLFICVVIPIGIGCLHIWDAIKFSVIFLAAYLVGFIFTNNIQKCCTNKLQSLQNMSLYFGFILISPILLLKCCFSSLIILGFLFILIIVILVFFRKFYYIVYKFDFNFLVPPLIATIITIVVFSNFSEMISRTPVMYSTYFQDFYWFTAMTNSISDFNFSNSNFEFGTGIYHHILGLFPAAVISGLTNISTHTALWSITMPLAVFTAYSSVVLLLEFFELTKRYLIFGLLIFIFHFPCNPKCLFNERLTEIIWFGSGHTLPVLPTWAAVYVVSIPFFIVIYQCVKLNKGNILMVSLLAFMLAWSKITAVFVFYVIIYCFILFCDRKLFSSRQMLLIFSAIPVLILIFLFYNKSSAHFILEPGRIILENLKVSELSVLNFTKAILLGLAIIVVWIGVKFFLLLTMRKVDRFFAMSLLITLLICILIQTVFKIKSFNSAGVAIDDSSFDLQQFTRSTFIYIDIFCLVVFMRSIQRFDHMNYSNVRLPIFFLPIFYSLFCCIMFYRNFYFYFTNYKVIKRSWDTEVVFELRNYRNTKKAMISNWEYSGQFIAAHDVNNFYLTIANRNGGYTYNYSNMANYLDLSDFIESKITKYPLFLKENGVKLLVATPDTKLFFENLVVKGKVCQIKNTKWLYIVSDI
jgi:hypothetical protein